MKQDIKAHHYVTLPVGRATLSFAPSPSVPASNFLEIGRLWKLLISQNRALDKSNWGSKVEI